MGDGTLPVRQLLALAPLSKRAHDEIEQIEEAPIDSLPGLSSDDKKQRLSRISYEAFLRDIVRVDASVLIYYRARSMDEQGVGTDALSALDCRPWGCRAFKE